MPSDRPQPGETLAAIALGSNLGDRARHLGDAVAALRDAPCVRVEAVSAYHETAPVGPPGQGPYLNAAAVVTTTLAPSDLLALLLSIERAAGRVRVDGQRWGPRTLDLDLLLFGDQRVELPGLTVPHPRMHERRFVLAPLAEILPDAIVPGRARRVAELLHALPEEAA